MQDRRTFAFVLASVFLVAGCGHSRFAGVDRSEAQRQAVGVERGWPPLVQDEFEPYPRKAAVVATVRDETSTGREAWLTIFRYRGGPSDPDAGCVWTWKSHGRWPFVFEEVPTVGWGHPGTVHDRCVARAQQFGVLGRNATVADEEFWQVAYPEPVSPFGPVARGSYVADPLATDGISQTAIPARFPNRTARGTVGFGGFVVDGARSTPVPGAVVWIWPSAATDGVFTQVPPRRPPPGAVKSVSDRLGAIAILDLPRKRRGYDVLVRAVRYGPDYEVHLFDRGQDGMFVGDLALERTPSFYDDSEPVFHRG